MRPMFKTDEAIQEFMGLEFKKEMVYIQNGLIEKNDDAQTYIEMYDGGKIPIKIQPKLLRDFRTSFEFRNNIIRVCGFSVVTMNWVKQLSTKLVGKHGLEIMAGRGALSKALQDCGISMICTDSYDWESKTRFSTWRNHFIDVENLSAMDAVIKYGEDIDFIICSWPPYCGNDFVQALNKLYEINPNCEIIYIGEEEGGCTADDEFFETYDLTSIIDVNRIYPQFRGINDYVFYATKADSHITYAHEIEN